MVEWNLVTFGVALHWLTCLIVDDLVSKLLTHLLLSLLAHNVEQRRSDVRFYLMSLNDLGHLVDDLSLILWLKSSLAMGQVNSEFRQPVELNTFAR